MKPFVFYSVFKLIPRCWNAEHTHISDINRFTVKPDEGIICEERPYTYIGIILSKNGLAVFM